ncbi:hypothetical protein MVEN_00753900 [Mycena venus]|uniref:F-box domain-containing protein n=1 Tax=Mycena venus TaxID=2733690 RepID=A0A8H7D3M1_9AGAR|nr:hypothetical protein MVEN_00753900 [Mycena venus]
MDVDKPFAAQFRSTLLELPIDNIFQILQFADPADIFVFGQTCKKFFEVTATRSVWMNALRRVCEINGLFVPSFPYDDMSFSELQRAATFGAAPRFTRRLYKQAANNAVSTVPLAPLSRRIFRPRVTKFSSAATEEPGLLKTVNLVPGGRFLIITTSTLMHLWDLGYDATKLIKPHALASIALPKPDSEPTISILPTEDGTGIEVMVVMFKIGETTTIANYHIFPLDTHPEFLPVSEPHTANMLMRGFLAKPGCGVVHDGREIFVWNTARNLWASWKADKIPDKVFAYRDLIVGVDTKTITLWEMPTPHYETAAASGLEDYLPLLTLSHPFSGGQELDIALTGDWFCSTDTKPSFLSLIGWKGSRRYIARYMMHSFDRRANHNLPGSIPILMDQISMTGAGDHLDYCTEIQPCGGDALALWTSQESPAVIEVSISPLPTEKKNEGPPIKTVRLFESRGDRPDDFEFSICPITGRLCTMTGQGNEIIVLDFLIPSWKDEY